MPLGGGKEAWYSYNDEVVTRVTAQQVRQLVWGAGKVETWGARRLVVLRPEACMVQVVRNLTRGAGEEQTHCPAQTLSC